jgi:hypothetical protein
MASGFIAGLLFVSLPVLIAPDHRHRVRTAAIAVGAAIALLLVAQGGVWLWQGALAAACGASVALLVRARNAA